MAAIIVSCKPMDLISGFFSHTATRVPNRASWGGNRPLLHQTAKQNIDQLSQEPSDV